MENFKRDGRVMTTVPVDLQGPFLLTIFKQCIILYKIVNFRKKSFTKCYIKTSKLSYYK